MSDGVAAPALSVVLASPGPFPLIAAAVASLQRQSAADRIELVLVTSDDSWLDGVPEGTFEPFAGVRLVEVPGEKLTGALRAAGARASTASVVAMCEDHVRHSEGWADALIARHREPWAAVGVAFNNANPESLISWADFVLAYGPWIAPVEGGPVDLLPGHNSSYKRDVLLGYDDALGELLDAESSLFWDLRAQGRELYLDPAAEIWHVNFARLRIWLGVQYHAGRVFAGERGRYAGWSRARRTFYALASPLIPLVRFSRCIAPARRAPGAPTLRLMGPLALGLVADAAGQFMGYAAGIGGSRHAFAWHEFDRVGVNEGRVVQ